MSIPASLDPANRVQLPAQWLADLGVHGLVLLDKTDEGILVRPCPRATWDEISANKLVIGSAPPDPNPDNVELTGDDFLY